jgi:hypothetical protein
VKAFCDAAAAAGASKNTRAENFFVEEGKVEESPPLSLATTSQKTSASSSSSSSSAASDVFSEQDIERSIKTILTSAPASFDSKGNQAKLYRVKKVGLPPIPFYCLDMDLGLTELFRCHRPYCSLWEIKEPIYPELDAALEKVFGEAHSSLIGQHLAAFEWELQISSSLRSCPYSAINEELNDFKRLILGDRWGGREGEDVIRLDGQEKETGQPVLNNPVYWRHLTTHLEAISLQLERAPAAFRGQSGWKKLSQLFAGFVVAIVGAGLAIHWGAVASLTIAGFAVGSGVAALSYLAYDWYALRQTRHRLFSPLQNVGAEFVKVVKDGMLPPPPLGGPGGEGRRESAHASLRL